MRLLFLEETPRFGGGSERMTLSLCEYAASHGHETTLAHADAGEMVDAYRRAGTACHRIPARPLAARRPFDAARSLRALVTLARHVRADVLFTSQVNYVSLIAASAWITRSVSAVHLGLTYDYNSPLFRTGMRHISLGVAPSTHTAQGWIDRGWPPASLSVIPNGVDTARFSRGDGREIARSRCGFPTTGELVAYVGRLVPE
jgi:glycosyltransferase involved in cell wall biosynthesis